MTSARRRASRVLYSSRIQYRALRSLLGVVTMSAAALLIAKLVLVG